MFDHINLDALLATTDRVCKRVASEVPLGEHHGSSWLFDRLMRMFEDRAVVSVTIPVYINLVGPGEVTIGRDGSLVIRRSEETQGA